MRQNRSLILNTLLLLCGCTFLVYQMQELALDHLGDTGREHLRKRPAPAALNLDLLREPELGAGSSVLGSSARVSSALESNMPAPSVSGSSASSQSASVSKYSGQSVKGSSDAGSTSAARIWITMGLCWSSNTKYHDKGKFPYKAAAPLSARLWQILTPAKVILQVRKKY